MMQTKTQLVIEKCVLECDRSLEEMCSEVDSDAEKRFDMLQARIEQSMSLVVEFAENSPEKNASSPYRDDAAQFLRKTGNVYRSVVGSQTADLEDA